MGDVFVAGVSMLKFGRYNDRDDKTPLVQYFAPVAVGATTDGFNEPRSIATTSSSWWGV